MSEQLPKQQPEQIGSATVEPARQDGILPGGALYGMQQITVRTTNAPTLPVQDIERLNQLNPNFAERAIALVESEAQFRREFAKQREQNVYQERVLGLTLGALIAIVGIVCGVIAAWLDHPGIASLLVGSSLIGIVSLIVAYSHGDYQKKTGTGKTPPDKAKS